MHRSVVALVSVISVAACGETTAPPQSSIVEVKETSAGLPSRFIVLGRINRFVDSVQYNIQGLRIGAGICGWEGERTLAPASVYRRDWRPMTP